MNEPNSNAYIGRVHPNHMSSSLVQIYARNGVYTITDGQKKAIVVGNRQDAELAADFMGDGLPVKTIKAMLNAN